ncbi:Ran-binding protein 10 [Smittium mucronatum]|uniref:Ran-binding protein 10 n=1 Tax=Smittium mucronatum TaxID=133383 RepID=A0A1R0H8M5_9FUNG|nr:Ran-binding protein 10 [Smittium mucronatum]
MNNIESEEDSPNNNPQALDENSSSTSRRPRVSLNLLNNRGPETNRRRSNNSSSSSFPLFLENSENFQHGLLRNTFDFFSRENRNLNASTSMDPPIVSINRLPRRTSGGAASPSTSIPNPSRATQLSPPSVTNSSFRRFNRFLTQNSAAGRIHLGALLSALGAPNRDPSLDETTQSISFFDHSESDDSNFDDSQDENELNDDDQEEISDFDADSSMSETSDLSESFPNFCDSHFPLEDDDAIDLQKPETIDLSQKLFLPTYLVNSYFGMTRIKYLNTIKSFFTSLKTDAEDLHFEPDQNELSEDSFDQDSLPLLNQIDSEHSTSHASSRESIHLSSPPTAEEFLQFISKPRIVSSSEYDVFLELHYEFKCSLRFPTHWSKKDFNKNVKPDSDLLHLSYVGKGRDDTHAGMIRTDYCIPPNCGIFYYEIEIQNKGKNGYIGVGFTGLKVSLNRLPGWDLDSWGYHGDDGNSFISNSSGKPYGPKFTAGDIIGCGVNFVTQEIFFVKNGVFLGVAVKDLKFSNLLYPTAGLRTVGEKVLANFGQSPFVYDIESYVYEQERRLWRTILNSEISSLLGLPSSAQSLPVTHKTSDSDLPGTCQTNPLTPQKIVSNTLVNGVGIDLQPSQKSIRNLLKSNLGSSHSSNIHYTKPSCTNGIYDLGDEPLLFEFITNPTLNSPESKTRASSLPNIPSTKDALNELILSYMIHNGYNKSADAFSKNTYGICSISLKKEKSKSTNSELSSPRSANSLLGQLIETNSERIQDLLNSRINRVKTRKQICEYVRQGKIHMALREIRNHYPHLVYFDPTVIFELRRSYFVELARVANSESSSVFHLYPNDSSPSDYNSFTSNTFLAQDINITPSNGPIDKSTNCFTNSIRMNQLESNQNGIAEGIEDSIINDKLDDKMDIDDIDFNQKLSSMHHEENFNTIHKPCNDIEPRIPTTESHVCLVPGKRTHSTSEAMDVEENVFKDQTDISQGFADINDHTKLHNSDKENWENMMEYMDPSTMTPRECAKAMVSFGRSLSGHYSSSMINDVENKLQSIFLIIAYPDPITNVATAHLFENSSLFRTAELVNTRILDSEGKSNVSPLEQVYSQAQQCVDTINTTLKMTVGSLVNMNKKYKYSF